MLFRSTADTTTSGTTEPCGECCKENAHLSDEGVAMELDDDEKEHAMDEEGDVEDFDDDDDEQEDEEDDDDDDDDVGDNDNDDGDDQNDDEESNASSAWERAHGYRADISRFVFHNVSSDEEENDDNDGDGEAETDLQHHHPWFGRRAARQVVVRALGGVTRTGFTR